jgi:YggT family protein
VARLICTLLQLYFIALFARIILSWFPIQPGTAMASINQFLHRITEPVLGPIRRLLPPVRLGSMGLDLSPMLVLLGIIVLQGALCG